MLTLLPLFLSLFLMSVYWRPCEDAEENFFVFFHIQRRGKRQGPR